MANMITYRNRSPFFPESRMFEDFMRPFFTGTHASFPVDVRDLGNSYLLEAELPGVSKDGIHLNLDDGVLTIRAEWQQETNDENGKNGYLISERKYGSVERSFSVENIREEEITAEYTDGVLRLTLPKNVPAVKQARKIEIQ